MAEKGSMNLLRSFLNYKYIILSIWILIAIYYTHGAIGYHAINNYLIFKYTYFNAVWGHNLYANYPQFYGDSNHYGPIFSLIMTPFALLPGNAGTYLWQVCNVLFLFSVIRLLPLSDTKKNIICLICTQELVISLKEFQTNGAIAALIMLAWIMVENKKDFWASLFIMLGLFIKLYGVIGIVFFLLSKQKKQFITGLFVWAAVLFVLPMIFFSPTFIAHSYIDWYHSLVSKNAQNTDIHTLYQDVSVMGMVRRIVGHHITLLPILITGVGLFVASCLKTYASDDMRSKLLMLCSCLLFVVLFSTGSENVTYIIAFTGVGIWFMTSPRPLSAYTIAVFVFALYCGSLYGTDIFPAYVKKNIINPYALKALPCLVVWLTIIAEMFSKKTAPQQAHLVEFNKNITPTI